MNSVTIRSPSALLPSLNCAHDDRAISYHANAIMLESASNVSRSITRLLAVGFCAAAIFESYASPGYLNQWVIRRYKDEIVMVICASIVTKFFEECSAYYEQMVQLPAMYTTNSVQQEN